VAQREDGTPLHGASERGHVDLARSLIVHGADAAAQNRFKSVTHGSSHTWLDHLGTGPQGPRWLSDGFIFLDLNRIYDTLTRP